MKSKISILVLVILLFGSMVFVAAQDTSATVVSNPLNFRDAPSVNATILARLGYETIYPALSQSVSGYWYELEVDGARGWVCARFVTLSAAASELPLNTSVVDEDCSGVTLTVNPGVVAPVVVEVTEAPSPDAPVVTISSVPEYGRRGYMRGRVTGLDDTSQYKAVCFIYRGGWYNKPYWSRPDTALTGAGYFSCYVSTGTNDELATAFLVLIVPRSVVTPLVSGGDIPTEFSSQAVARDSLQRTAP